MDIAHEQRFFLYWLITRRAGGRMEALTMRATGRKVEVLPVFGFEEEAQMFVHLAALGDAWRVRQTSAGELVSLLYGPCASVIGVALDPVPNVASDAADDGFLGRREFVSLLSEQQKTWFSFEKTLWNEPSHVPADRASRRSTEAV